MKKTIQLLLFVGLAALATGCATPYMIDRGRDAKDIFTACLGSGGGIGARVGPIGTGLLLECQGSGLRGGDLLTRSNYQNAGLPFPSDAEISLLVWGGDCFDGSQLVQQRGKSVASLMILGLNLPIPIGTDEEVRQWREKLAKAQGREPGEAKWCRVPYFTQVEVTVGFWRTIRVGFNPGEILDFILGWTTIDIFNDDLEWDKTKSNKTPEHISEGRERPSENAQR